MDDRFSPSVAVAPARTQGKHAAALLELVLRRGGRITRALEGALQTSAPWAQAASGCATLACACVVATVMISTGPNPLRATGHDLLLPLDAAWRVLSGQIPHNDFYSPLGPVFAYWMALWMKLFGPVPSIVHYALLGQGVLLAGFAWCAARPRLTALASFLFSVFVLLVASAPFPVGWPSDQLDTAMAYNRMAFGIVAILIVEAGFPLRGPMAPPRREAVIAGAAFGVLTLLKFNFAAIALGVQLLVLLHTHPRRLATRALGFTLGAAAVAALFFAVLGVSPARFLADMWMVRQVHADAAPRTLPVVEELARELKPQIWVLASGPALGALLLAAAPAGSWLRRGRAALRLGVVFALLVASDLALGVTNTQMPALVLAPLSCLFALQALASHEPARDAASSASSGARASLLERLLDSSAPRISCSLLCAYLWMGSCMEPIRGLRESLRYERHPTWPEYALGGGSFERVKIPFTPVDRYPVIEHAGVELLKRNISPGDKVVTLDFSNPFNFTLGLQPARGDALWWHETKTFTTTTFPAAERVFQEADLVMVARRWTRFVMPVYEGFLDAHYHPLATNSEWILLRRNPAPKT
jgi:hypothetical protein